MRAVLVALLAAAAAVVVHADSVYTVVNAATKHTVDVQAKEVRHNCWSSSVGGQQDLEFSTNVNGDCIVNLDEVVLTVRGNTYVNCSLLFSNVYQRNQASGLGIWTGNAAVVDVSAAGQMCVASSTTAVGNASLPVMAYPSCPLCPESVAGLATKYSADSVMNVGANTIQTKWYTSLYGSHCWSSSVSQGAGNYITGHGGADYGCTSPINRVHFSAPDAVGCNVTLEPAVPHAATFVTGVTAQGQVCVQSALVPASVQVQLQGPCPRCDGL